MKHNSEPALLHHREGGAEVAAIRGFRSITGRREIGTTSVENAEPPDMSLVRRIKDAIKLSPLLLRCIYHYQAVKFSLPTAYRREWSERCDDMLQCPDLADIPRVPDAGQLRGDTLVMHNGLLVETGGYYGYHMARMMRLGGGVAEPQQEKAFGQILPFIPPGGVMLELGAYWAFYSMWFQQRVPQARNYLSEPIEAHLSVGRRNFAQNRMTGTFERAMIGAASGVAADGTPIIALDDLLAREKIDFVHLIHADVQGSEHDMLIGARRAFADARVGYVFISTHSEDSHHRCRSFLAEHGMKLLADATPTQSYSSDGLLVARSPSIAGPERILISHKT
jgi:methyltransferase FkbM-like protein